MKIIKKVITILITIVMISTPTATAHAQDLSQYYAMSAQLMQMAMIMQAQAAQLMGAYGAQAPIVTQPTAQAVVPAVDLQAQQALAMQQAQTIAIQQAQAQAMAQTQAMAQAQQALLLAQAQAPAPAVAPVVVTAPTVPQSSGYYVLNTGSKKIHYPECQAVSKMSATHYQETIKSRDELIADGYTPCGICNP